jgi:hypothetical protein
LIAIGESVFAVERLVPFGVVARESTWLPIGWVQFGIPVHNVPPHAVMLFFEYVCVNDSPIEDVIGGIALSGVFDSWLFDEMSARE